MVTAELSISIKNCVVTILCSFVFYYVTRVSIFGVFIHVLHLCVWLNLAGMLTQALLGLQFFQPSRRGDGTE